MNKYRRHYDLVDSVLEDKKVCIIGIALLVILCFNVIPVYSDMQVLSEFSHTQVGREARAAYIRTIISLKNIDPSIYKPIADAIRRFNPIQTYYIYPNNPAPYLHRLELYNITPPMAPSRSALMWYNPSPLRGVDVIVYHSLPIKGEIYCGNMFSVFFNISLSDAEHAMTIYVEIPDSKPIDFGRAWIGCEDKLMWYPPFLGLKEYANGTDEYFFDRQAFDVALPAVREGILGILKSMTTPEDIGTYEGGSFRLDMWTPSAVILSNGTVLRNITYIAIDWWRYPPWSTQRIKTYEFKKPQEAIIYMNNDGSVTILLGNGQSIIVPKGQALVNTPNPDEPSCVNWANFTRVTITEMTSSEKYPLIGFYVEDGMLWTSVREYLIWNNEIDFLEELEEAIEKLGTALTFEWLKTPLEQWELSYWNETIKLPNGTTEVKMHRSLYLHSTIPWPYGDPEAFILIPSQAQDIQIRGDMIIFKVQRTLGSPVIFSTSNYWIWIIVCTGAILVSGLIIMIKRSKYRSL
jgi:hypothetical protein